jgi:hypothetical protein
MTRGYKDDNGVFHPISEGRGGRSVRMRQKGSSLAGLPSAGIRHEGSLVSEGYRLKETKEKRHKALDEALGRYGYKGTVDKLTELEALNKNHPAKRAQIHSDIEYLQALHSPKA